jgi:putative copper resistance protein D
MSPMHFFDAIVLWLHVLAAAIFIGPQVFLVFVAMPAVRTLADVKARQQVTRAITRGFGALGGGALGVLILTGLWNYNVAKDEGLIDFKRYFIALQIKLTLVLIVVVLTIVHGAVLGTRLQRLQAENAPEDEVAKVRQWSIMTSIGTLAASILILLCASILGSAWSQGGGLR